MALISSTIPNFVNGVSQQPYTLRLSSQGEAQENGLSTVSQGMRKRPPTEHLAKLSNTPLSDAFLHMINRGDSEQYEVIVTNGDLKVYDLAGNAKTVNFTDKPYLNTALAASDSFALTTVADYTFIANRTKKVASSTGLGSTRPYEALINVKAGNYGKTYSIMVNGVGRASYSTPNGSTATDAPFVATDYIAQQLAAALNTGVAAVAVAVSGISYTRLIGAIWTVQFTLPAGKNPGNTTVLLSGTPTGYSNVSGTTWSASYSSNTYAAPSVTAVEYSGGAAPVLGVTQYGSVIYITATTDFTISCEDGFNNNALVSIKGQLQKFSDLPSNPRVDGFVVEIVGEQTSDFDNYWVKFDAKGTSNNVGVWRESLQSGIPVALEPNTLPHLLIREADGTFTFKPADWADRIVGDLKSNPDPSLVGQVINDIFFYENRLGFLSDENFVMSETGKYFNLYRTTVTTLLDSDPVDVNVATNKVAVLRHALGFNKQLLLFSDQQQFVADNTQLMTPKKVPIKPSTDFWVNNEAKPVAAGRNVYFAMDKGAYTAIREYAASLDNSTSNDAQDVTSHVPKYLPSGIVKIASSPSEDALVLLSKNDRTKLYIYKFYFSANEKLQSSWSRFSLAPGSTILTCEFIKSVLYLVVSRPSGVYLERMDFSVGGIGAGEPYQVLLDRKVQLAPGALSFDGTYTVLSSIGYLPNDGAYMTVAKAGGTIKAGQLSTVLFDGTTAKIKGDFTGSGGLSFGQRFMWRYTLSTLAVKTTSRISGVQSETGGRTQVRNISFNHAETGYYQVKVTPEARQTYTYTFAGKYLGSSTAQIGLEAMATGRFAVPVMSKNIKTTITLESDMPLPVSILSADWEAFFVKRGQPV